MAYCTFLGDGFEDIEALSFIDLLRRAKVSVDIYGVDKEFIVSRSKVVYKTEKTFRSEGDVAFESYDGILLPGGPGVDDLVNNKALLAVIRKFFGTGKLVFAICAAPRLLDAAGVLDGRRYTCYPGTPIKSGTHVDESVVVDGNVVTSQGVGTALAAAIKLVEIIVSKEEAAKQAEKVVFG
ncbi:MAG: DJ-1/PfpI family protein [Spirochaetales bacterium]|nr:DJ-1/PfpI family protein [Spirochaetales bacterium]